ncbi:hypothetical protein LTR97_004426 [Elasticomyces elasticus]|uniref:Uncharacterized protein n=1 Tax=Elasticomyces elasticus TaxID=574655 RepID=A0AAN7WAJ6_9PEZI|nr:hypothetical protein LTR97_004426 [Elasticomyces elasticus]
MASPGGWTLLTLPPEMRNRIYREVLVEGDIYIHTHSRFLPIEPALMRVCRQTREEALAIYHKENSFVFDIDENDARNLINWCKSASRRKNSEIAFEVGHSQNWENLMAWAAATFRRECVAPPLIYPDGDTAVPAAVHVLEVASQLKDCSVTWPAAEAVLMQMRKAMAVENPAWAQDQA